MGLGEELCFVVYIWLGARICGRLLLVCFVSGGGFRVVEILLEGLLVVGLVFCTILLVVILVFMWVMLCFAE